MAQMKVYINPMKNLAQIAERNALAKSLKIVDVYLYLRMQTCHENSVGVPLITCAFTIP